MHKATIKTYRIHAERHTDETVTLLRKARKMLTSAMSFREKVGDHCEFTLLAAAEVMLLTVLDLTFQDSVPPHYRSR